MCLRVSGLGFSRMGAVFSTQGFKVWLRVQSVEL